MEFLIAVMIVYIWWALGFIGTVCCILTDSDVKRSDISEISTIAILGLLVWVVFIGKVVGLLFTKLFSSPHTEVKKDTILFKQWKGWE